MCSLENGDLTIGHGDFTRDMSANGIKWVCLKKGILGQNVTCVLPFFFRGVRDFLNHSIWGHGHGPNFQTRPWLAAQHAVPMGSTTYWKSY